MTEHSTDNASSTTDTNPGRPLYEGATEDDRETGFGPDDTTPDDDPDEAPPSGKGSGPRRGGVSWPEPRKVPDPEQPWVSTTDVPFELAP